MSSEADDAKMWEELDLLCKKPQTAADLEASLAAETEAVLKTLADPNCFVVKDDQTPAARDRSPLIDQLDQAAALAKEFGDAIVTSLIQSALARLRD